MAEKPDKFPIYKNDKIVFVGKKEKQMYDLQTAIKEVKDIYDVENLEKIHKIMGRFEDYKEDEEFKGLIQEEQYKNVMDEGEKKLKEYDAKILELNKIGGKELVKQYEEGLVEIVKKKENEYKEKQKKKGVMSYVYTAAKAINPSSNAINPSSNAISNTGGKSKQKSKRKRKSKKLRKRRKSSKLKRKTRK